MIGYVAVKPDAGTRKILTDWMSALNLAEDTVKPEYLHATLVYDRRSSMRDMQTESDKSRRYVAYAQRVSIIGKADAPAMVIELSSEDLKIRHEELKRLGFKHSYDRLRPHITISYDPGMNWQTATSAGIALVDLIGTPLILTDEHWKSLT